MKKTRNYNNIARENKGYRASVEIEPDYSNEPYQLLTEYRTLGDRKYKELRDTYNYIKSRCCKYLVVKYKKQIRGKTYYITEEWYCNDKLLGMNKIHQFVIYDIDNEKQVKAMRTYEETMQ